MNFFLIEVRDIICLEDFIKLDLFKNFYINIEYFRYDRENNLLWLGKDAFLG